MKRRGTVPPEEQPIRRRIVAFGALWLAVSAAALATPACYERNCEGSVETYGIEPGEGRMLDENTWESNAVDEDWLWFPRQRHYIFDLPVLGGRKPSLVLPYVTTTPDPNATNATIGSGNTAELLRQTANRVDLKNDTCSDLYLRLYIQVPPLPPSADAAPTQTADAGADDADTEAAGDAEANR